MACRPATLSAAAAPVLVGTAIASHEAPLRLGTFLGTLAGAGFLQIASNLANDVFDHEKGADTEDRLGPTRAVQAGLLTGAQMKRGLYVCLFFALLVGCYLTWVAGPVVVAIGLVSMLAAVAYTGGPYPLGYHGLGDLFVLIFFGFVAVGGSAFVQLGYVPSLALLAALPIGAVTTNILVVNNLRDRHTDVHAGKRTLAVRFGRRFAELQYIALYGISYSIPVFLAIGPQWSIWVLAPLLTIPLALKNISGVCATEGAGLNAYLIKSAKLVFFYGALFALGLWQGKLS